MGRRPTNPQICSHLPMLVRVFEMSEGDVLELGTGYFSSLILRWLSDVSKRHVYAYESRWSWNKRVERLRGEYYHTVLCPNWDAADFEKQRWGMAFIDHSPSERRHIDVARLANLVDYIVLHDTQPKDDATYYLFSKIWHLFKYRYDYTKYPNWTSVVSNFKDLENLKIP